MAFPPSHHESAVLDKNVGSDRALRGHVVTAFIVQKGPSDSVNTSQPISRTARIRTSIFGCLSSVLLL